MRRLLLLIFFLPGMLRAQNPTYPYTHAHDVSINDTWQAPCGWGGTATQQFQAAASNVPNGGVVDMTCYMGPVTLTADVFSPIAIPVTIILPSFTVTVNANATVPANLTVIYRNGSSLAAGPGFVLTRKDTPYRASSFQRLIEAPSTAATLTPTTGGSFSPGKLYYVVTATVAGGETQGSSEASLTLTSGQNAVSLSWPTVTGAAGYNVYRGTSAGGEHVYYSTVGASFTDTNAAGTAGSPPAQNTAWITLSSAAGPPGPATPCNGSTVICADTMAGSTLDAKLTAAIALLPSGGTIDARNFSGTQLISANVAMTHGITLWLGAYTLNEAPGVGFTVTNNDQIVGLGEYLTIITGNGTSPMLQQATSTYAAGVSGLVFTNFTVGNNVNKPTRPPTWLANHTYAPGAQIMPKTPSGYAYVTTLGGISGATEPSPWGTTPGGDTADGTITDWVCTLVSTITPVPNSNDFSMLFPAVLNSQFTWLNGYATYGWYTGLHSIYRPDLPSGGGCNCYNRMTRGQITGWAIGVMDGLNGNSNTFEHVQGGGNDAFVVSQLAEGHFTKPDVEAAGGGFDVWGYADINGGYLQSNGPNSTGVFTWAAQYPYLGGMAVKDAAGYEWRCITPGTSGTTFPAFPSTPASFAQLTESTGVVWQHNLYQDFIREPNSTITLEGIFSGANGLDDSQLPSYPYNLDTAIFTGMSPYWTKAPWVYTQRLFSRDTQEFSGGTDIQAITYATNPPTLPTIPSLSVINGVHYPTGYCTPGTAPCNQTLYYKLNYNTVNGSEVPAGVPVGLTNYVTVTNAPAQNVLGTVVTASGSGGTAYVTGDTDTLTCLKQSTRPILTVTASGGAVTAVSITNAGVGVEAPCSQFTTSGSGHGATFNVDAPYVIITPPQLTVSGWPSSQKGALLGNWDVTYSATSGGTYAAVGPVHIGTAVIVPGDCGLYNGLVCDWGWPPVAYTASTRNMTGDIWIGNINENYQEIHNGRFYLMPNLSVPLTDGAAWELGTNYTFYPHTNLVLRPPSGGTGAGWGLAYDNDLAAAHTYACELTNTPAMTCGMLSGSLTTSFPGGLTASLSGNASTATSLAGSPTQCSGGEFATGIAASGDANCGTPSGAGTVTSSGYTSGSPVAAFSTSTNITPASSSNIVALFSTCSGVQYLGADGSCHSAGTGTMTSSGYTSGTPLAAFSSAANVTPATYSNVVALFSSCSGTQYLGYDGNCHTAPSGMVYPGAGMVISTGTAWGTSLTEVDNKIVCGLSSAFTVDTLSNCAGSQTANLFFAAPNGSAGNATFRAIVAADLPGSITSSTSGNAGTATALASAPGQCNSTTQYALGIAANGTANCANLGQTSFRAVTGSTDTIVSTDVGNGVTYNGASSVTVTLPTATSLGIAKPGITLINATSGSNTTVTVNATTWSIYPNDGTSGASSFVCAQGQYCFFYLSSAGGAWAVESHEPQTTAGSNIAFTRSAAGLSIAFTGPAPTASALASSPTQCSATGPLFATGVAASGNANCVGSQTANYVYASPNGLAGNPAFRALVGADLPGSITSNTTGNAATATALAATPTQCSSQFATGVAASGNANCLTVTSSYVDASVMVDGTNTTTTAGKVPASTTTAGAYTPADFVNPPMIIPAVNCNNATAGTGWSLPTSGAPTVACRTGTNVQAGVAQFAQSNSAQFQVDIPGNADLTAAVYAKIYFTQGANTTASQTIVMQMATACSSTTDDPAFNSAQAFSTATTGGTVNTPYIETLSSVTMTGCSAGGNMNVKISRSGGDTATTAPNVYWISLTFQSLNTPGAN